MPREAVNFAAWRLFKAFEAEGAALLAAAPSLKTLPPGCEVMSVGQRQWLIKPSFHPAARQRR